MSEKKPQAGEFWEKEGIRLRIIGAKKNGIIVGEHECSSIDLFHPQHGWEHLPDCTGWDWQPEVFPQYWSTLDTAPQPGAYLRRTDKDTFVVVYKKGGESDIREWGARDHVLRTQLTREQAEALVQKPAPVEPVESPDDWVTQDRVPPRHSIDQVQWSNWHRSKWVDAVGKWEGEQHGFIDKDDESTLRVRCRRKDLPPMPEPEKPKTRKVIIHDVVFFDAPGLDVFMTLSDYAFQDIAEDWQHHRIVNTREVEVPL